MDTQNYQQNKGFRLLKFEDIETAQSIEEEFFPDDPLEEMLYGIEVNRELSAVSRQTKSIHSTEGRELEKKVKHLRFYVNEISNHFGLDD